MLHDRDHILTLLTEAILARSNKGYSLGTCASVAEMTLQNYDRARMCPRCGSPIEDVGVRVRFVGDRKPMADDLRDD